MKLVVAVAGGGEWAWLDSFDFDSVGISPVVLHLEDGGPPGPRPSRAIGFRKSDRDGLPLPDFAEIVNTLSAEEPDACFVLTDTVFGALLSIGARTLAIPVFSLVLREDDLPPAMPPLETGRRPGLFFLADAGLFTAALSNPHYGSTLLPTGHPAADRDAARRILSAIERWSRGALDPPEPDLTVIVPAYREAKNLPHVCDRLLEAFADQPIAPEILLIDDASPDDTRAIALDQMWRSSRIRAFSKPTPRGMGNAIRYGFARARAPVVAVTMGDGSDEVARIPEMFRKVRDEGFGLAIGSRYRHRQNYASVPLLYRFWSRFFRLVAWAVIGLKLNDYTNAFRVFHRRIFDRYGPESGGFEISPEITFKAWFATRRVTEVDVRHLKRSSGQSSFSFLRAGPGYGKILIKAFVNRLTGRWFTLDW